MMRRLVHHLVAATALIPMWGLARSPALASLSSHANRVLPHTRAHQPSDTLKPGTIEPISQTTRADRGTHVPERWTPEVLTRGVLWVLAIRGTPSSTTIMG
jgi:hypothetical protein